ncbi:hypothetical protein K2173_017200 [Erythroxylum novogranatense]|uniref:Uncharacterized protein n=1 Tax=Erythroxylum novogranatense TaxID=1862640 RepID=A0AAV8U9B1_9ROSI|nr:hypothetical protein K2173_017200 [Erythroxylum novogranatense]
MDSRHSVDAADGIKVEYIPITDTEDPQLGFFDKLLPCCDYGIVCFLLGFVFPFMWYFATVLYFGGYYHKDPGERSGLGAYVVPIIPSSRSQRLALLVIVP